MGKKTLNLALGIALVIALVAVPPASAESAPPIRVLLDGIPVPLAGEPALVDGRVYVPARALLTALEADATEVRELGTRKLVAAWRGLVLEVRGNAQTALVNGVPSDLGAPPKVMGDALYVPVRWLAEALGARVEWLSASRVVSLSLAGEEALPRVGSYAHLQALVTEAVERSTSHAGPIRVMRGMAVSATVDGEAAASADGSAAGGGFSQTNVQVAGVDEADVVKTDGEYLYQVSGDRLVIIRAVPADEMDVVAEIPFGDGFRPRELYAEPGRLIVIGVTGRFDERMRIAGREENTQPKAAAAAVAAEAAVLPIRPLFVTTAAHVYDTADIRAPRLVRVLELEGDYLSSRKIGDSLYLVSNKWLDAYRIMEQECPPELAVPLVRDVAVNGGGHAAGGSEDAADNAADGAENAVADAADGAENAVADAADGSGDTAADAADDAADAAAGAAENAEDAAAGTSVGAAVTAANGADHAEDAAADAADGSSGAAGDVADRAKAPASEAADGAQEDGAFAPIPLDRIHYFPDFIEPNYLLIGAVDLADDAAMDVQVYLGSGQNVYASQEHLYTAVTRYGKPPFAPLGQPLAGAAIPRLAEASTDIYKFALLPGEVKFLAQGSVPGTIVNAFSMDEYDGHFRIATTTGYPWGEGDLQSKNHLFVLDENLRPAGSVEDIAPGERIYAVRFMGKRAYMVTFRTVDPLFAIDLSDPASPEVLGALKIPGYSNYLHPYDENHLIGFGKDTTEVTWKDADGNAIGTNAFYLGMKVSLFDVTDVENPIEKHVVTIGDRGTHSDLLTNHKALLFDREKGNLLAFPVDLYEVRGRTGGAVPEDGRPPAYGTFSYQGAYVYSLDPVRGFELRGRITHLDDDELLKAGQFWHNGDRFIRRILYIGDTLYTVSDTAIKASALGDLSEIGMLDTGERP